MGFDASIMAVNLCKTYIKQKLPNKISPLYDIYTCHKLSLFAVAAHSGANDVLSAFFVKGVRELNTLTTLTQTQHSWDLEHCVIPDLVQGQDLI